MKSVLMIAYWFPPEGNAASYRPFRFVRHLRRCGWNPAVLSLETDSYERHDPELLSLVPSETEIIRVRNPDPWQGFQAWRNKQAAAGGARAAGQGDGRRSCGAALRFQLRRVVNAVEPWIYHPDLAAGWIRPAAKAAVKLCARRRPDVIWATGMPWSAFIVARRAARLSRIPYVLDFRSAWTLVPNAFEARRPAWARRWDRAVLRRLFLEAQAVIFAYESEAECYRRAYPGALDASRIHIIPNGYEGEIEEFAAPAGELCKILYAGTLSAYGYETLLSALRELKQREPGRAGKLRLLFVGEGSEALGQEAARQEISCLIETLRPTTYSEIRRLQREAHALLMLERKPTMKGYELLAGAKLFGYLRAGRPILGVLPTGEAKRILGRVGATTVADVNSPEEIRALFSRFLEAWENGDLAFLLPERAACEAFSAERQTAALVRALEGKPPAEPFVPGSADIPPSLREEIRAWEDAERKEQRAKGKKQKAKAVRRPLSA